MWRRLRRSKLFRADNPCPVTQQAVLERVLKHLQSGKISDIIIKEEEDLRAGLSEEIVAKAERLAHAIVHDPQERLGALARSLRRD